MSIDFEVPAEAKAIREKVRKWVHEECIPAEKELDSKPLDEVLGKLRALKPRRIKTCVLLNKTARRVEPVFFLWGLVALLLLRPRAENFG